MAATSDESKDDNLWLSLLGQARAAESEHCTAVVLGESGCGAEALIQRLHVEATQGTQEPRVLQDSLSFSHVSIGAGKDADSDGPSEMKVWHLASMAQKDLLRFALTPEGLPQSAVIVCLDMSRPWSVEEKFEKWMAIVKDAANACAEKLDKGDVDAMKEAISKHVRTYKEPTPKAAGEGGEEKRSSARRADSAESIDMPLREGVLTTNIGVPVIVVCCNSDAASTEVASSQPRQRGQRPQVLTDRQLEFIQRRLRKGCLDYGAALMYVSSTTNVSSLLTNYVVHRISRSSSFLVPVQATDLRQTWIPSGWDSPNLLNYRGSEAAELSIDTPFNEVIPAPPEQSKSAVGAPGEGVTAHDDAEFLNKLLRKQKTDQGGSSRNPDDDSSSSSRRTSEVPRSKPSRTSTTSGGSKTKGAGTKGGVTKEDNPKLIKNFFESLLKPKPGKTAGRPSATAEARAGGEQALAGLKAKKASS